MSETEKNTDPFMALAQTLLKPENQSQPKAVTTLATHVDASKNRAQMIFEASLKAVQEVLCHLSLDDIEHPPHNWFDAILARQIAAHVAITQLGLTRTLYAEQYHRTQKSVRVAIDTVDDRMMSRPFADTYALIAARAAELNSKMDDVYDR